MPAEDQLDVTAGNDRDEAMPVMLDLVQPAVAIRRFGGRRDDLEANGARDLGRHPLWGQGEARHGGRRGMWLAAVGGQALGSV